MRIKTALISVSDKSGLPELAAALAQLNVRLLSTGGTAAALRKMNIAVDDLSDLTGFADMMGGRVKTLHPAIYAAILADPDLSAHRKELADHNLPKIDLVAVNFYPFKKGADDSRQNERALTELIDIGGPAMVRAAAKNYAQTAVLVNTADYPSFIGEMRARDGELTLQKRRQLAAAAFVAVADLDIAIANYFSSTTLREESPVAAYEDGKKLAGNDSPDGENSADKSSTDKNSDGENSDDKSSTNKNSTVHGDAVDGKDSTVDGENSATDGEDSAVSKNPAVCEDIAVCEDDFPVHYFLHLQKQAGLTYGENPHQRAACYHRAGVPAGYAQLQGAAASYNNLLDAHAAFSLVSLFERPAAAIIKHNNPCGAAVGDDLTAAFVRAHESDSASAFGGIVAFNETVGDETARALEGLFFEVVVAPQFDAEAKKIFAVKERLRLLATPALSVNTEMELRNIGDLFLAQTPDRPAGDIAMKVAGKIAPPEDALEDLLLAWRVAARTKSNAVVVAAGGATAGIGAGQMSRVESARLACRKLRAGGRYVAASDGFFPFADSVKELAKAGVVAIIQPGGSKRDDEIIAVADKLGVAMVLTGKRHFLH